MSVCYVAPRRMDARTLVLLTSDQATSVNSRHSLSRSNLLLIEQSRIAIGRSITLINQSKGRLDAQRKGVLRLR